MATDQQIIETLKATGHLDNPFGNSRTNDVNTAGLKINDPIVRVSLASYQSFNASPMEPLISHFHGERLSASVRPDGEVGPATRALFDLPRCACMDYDPTQEQEARGRGNWKGCYSVGDFHSVKIKFTNSPPSYLQPHFEVIKNNVRKMYAETGLLIHWVESGESNIHASFVRPTGGWIGRAIVSNNSSCGSNIWARFDNQYKPSNLVSEWTSLVAHEFGHNCGLSHSRGGVMNSYIVRGLPPTWKGDPSWGLLASRFGGQPVPIPGDDGGERKLVVAYEYDDGRFEKLYDLPSQGPMWPTGE